MVPIFAHPQAYPDQPHSHEPAKTSFAAQPTPPIHRAKLWAFGHREQPRQSDAGQRRVTIPGKSRTAELWRAWL